jgi:hypothetical protein
MAVAPWIVSDGLWERIEPLLPKVERRFRGRQPQRCHPADPVVEGSRLCAARSDGLDGVPSVSPLTAATTTTRTGASYAAAPSPRSHDGRLSTAPGSAAPAGWLSAPSLGCTSSSGCSSATTAATRSTKPSSRSAAASSASEGSDHHCESSSQGSDEDARGLARSGPMWHKSLECPRFG